VLEGEALRESILGIGLPVCASSKDFATDATYCPGEILLPPTAEASCKFLLLEPKNNGVLLVHANQDGSRSEFYPTRADLLCLRFAAERLTTTERVNEFDTLGFGI
jgi:hypothetical protein